MVAAIQELRRHKPAVLYLPDIDEWFETISDAARIALLQSIENNLPSHVLFLATSFKPFAELHNDIKELFCPNNTGLNSLFSGKSVIECTRPTQV